MIDYVTDLLITKMVSSQVYQLAMILCALPTAKLVVILAILFMLALLIRELKGSK
jgi:hypothetical protein